MADDLERRQLAAARYRSLLAGVEGISVQVVDEGDVSTYKDYTVRIDDAFGISRDATRAALAAEGIDTRCYFDPPVHAQQAYADLPPAKLPITDDVASRVISLPMFARRPLDSVEVVAEVLVSLGEHAEQLTSHSID